MNLIEKILKEATEYDKNFPTEEAAIEYFKKETGVYGFGSKKGKPKKRILNDKGWQIQLKNFLNFSKYLSLNEIEKMYSAVGKYRSRDYGRMNKSLRNDVTHLKMLIS